MQVTLGTAVGVDLDHVRPVQDGSRMWEKFFPFFFFPSLVMSNQKVYTVVFLLTQEEMWAKLKFNLVLYSFYKKR